MKKFTLLEYSLFRGVPAGDMETLVSCIDARMRFYNEGDDLAGLLNDKEHCFLILSGTIKVETETGEFFLLKEDSLFNEDTLRDAGLSIRSYKADTMLSVLSMNQEGISKVCWFSCFFHHLLAENAECLYEKLKKLELKKPA